jgi:hypothetical protein
MSDADQTVRGIHGVLAGDFQYTYSRNSLKYPNNERNAMAWLLTIPWTADFWLMKHSKNGVMFRSSYWTLGQTDSLLLSAQARFPSMTKTMLGRAIEILAREQTTDATASTWITDEVIDASR